MIWDDIAKDERYINASPELQMQMQDKFFDGYIAPKATEKGLDLDTVRSEFKKRISAPMPQGQPAPVAVENGQETTNQLANALFTPEKIQELRNKGPIDFWESFNYVTEKDIPVYGLYPQGKELGRLYAIKKLMDEGKTIDEIGDDNKEFVLGYLRKEVEKDIRGFTIGGDIVRGVSSMPSFLVEFALAAGSLGAIPTAKTAIKEGVKETAEKATAKSIIKSVGKYSAVAPLLMPSTYSNTAQRNIMSGIDITDKGEMIIKESESPIKSALMAYAGNSIEFGTELLGVGISKAVSPLMMSATNALPETVKLALYKGLQMIKPNARVSDLLSRIGWNGFLIEYGEEELARILNAGLSYIGSDITAEEALEQIKGNTHDRLVTAGVLGIAQGVSTASSMTINHFMKKGYTKEQATEISNNMTELEKDKLTIENYPDSKGSYTSVVEDTQKIMQADREAVTIQEGINEVVTQEQNELNPPTVENDNSSFSEVFDKGIKDFVFQYVNSKKTLESLSPEIKVAIRDFYGIAGTIKQFLSTGIWEEKDNRLVVTGKSLQHILDDFDNTVMHIEGDKTARLQDFNDFLIATRYEELLGREDVKVTEEQKAQTLGTLARLKTKYGDKLAWFEQYAQELYTFQKNILHRLVESGNMSEEQYNEIVKNNKKYIPFQRVFEDEPAFPVSTKGKFTKAKSPIKKIRGSEREIKNVLQSITENTARIITISERNRIAKMISDALVQVGEATPVPPQMVKKGTAKVKITYDKGLSESLDKGIELLGGQYQQVKTINRSSKTRGVYLPLENKILERIGTHNAKAHEFGHMLDSVLGLGGKILTKDTRKELENLAQERLVNGITVKGEKGEDIRLERDYMDTDASYKEYINSPEELVANFYDAYVTAPQLAREIAPKTSKLMDDFLNTTDKTWLKDIRPTLQKGTEEIEQDVWGASPFAPKETITVYENGKRQFYKVENEDALREIENTDDYINNFITKLLAAPTTILRKGATEYNPEFIFRNPLRDIQQAVIQSELYDINNIWKVPGQFIKSLFDVVKATDLYNERMAAGGMFETLMAQDDKGTAKNFSEFYTEVFNPKGKMFAKINPFHWVSVLGQVGEQTTRQMIYNEAINQGYGAKEAAMMSRDTIDFAVSGKTGKSLNRFIPFLNAGIRGTSTMFGKWKENPRLFLRKALVSQTIPAILLTGYYLYYADDDERNEFLNLPDWRRHLFFNFKIGDTWWAFPKAFAIGEIFATPFEFAMIANYSGEKPESKNLFMETVGGILGSVSPIQDIGSSIPVLFKWAIEETANYNFFTGRNIFPTYLERYTPSEQYNKNTPDILKEIGKVTDISPARLEHTIRSFTGGSGMLVVSVADKMLQELKKFNGERVPEAPEDLKNVPVIRGFIASYPMGSSSKEVQNFYENLKEYQQIEATAKKKEGKERQEYKRENRQAISNAQILKRANDKIKTIRKNIDKIKDNVTMSGKDKAERIRKLETQMTDVARIANYRIKGE